MKTSVIALSLFSAVAFALPEAHGGWGGNGGWDGKDKGWGWVIIQDYWKFTSTFSVKATPDQVVNGTTPTGGQPGAVGYYEFGLNSQKNFICYNIRLQNFGSATYQSPADTATHIHEAARGQSGPPRIAFPNPAYEGSPEERVSIGCLQGPFQTGVINNATGQDTGVGFNVAQIEANPSAFFADVHTNVAVPGAVRGQIA
ncbi:hypothetical protein M409DRAFT_66435 [Zasmidium cellare ATCC 36951]|uniref:CHRD domain-containing protein n=1 Tax=Zasmidium cellare ATCC 36951 TaxID=1080233 RepID=A0A6A6CJW3_ZASCE|nr:uncharacterized protein M409DRAFT_66435 [Zasmidium cellare ATCC 36951]KAF2166903.1 hypothetical protein M409DRAFT_66435 [Zasmidium cellare ATCC 36951]